MVAVSCTILTATGLIRGEPLFATIWMSVSSWPVIFLAGFMLSEPLTLPPRHWQKVFVAITTALVFSLPFHVGWFTSSPEFALLVGNVVAFVVARKQRSAIVLTLVKRQALTPTVDEFVFSLEKPAVFEPGQFIELTVPHKSDSRGIRRSFSITSVPGRNKISLGVKFYHPSSTFKKHLRQLKIGEKVMTTGITGDFVLPKDTSRKILLIAGGIGVTPFISHIIADGSRRDIQVLYFIRDKQEAAYKSILDESHAQVTYFVADDSSVDEAFQPGAHLTAEIINTYVKDLTERDVYISGPPAMVDATKKLASRAKTIHTDYFSGY
jgi:ferredoxin-NADP reductase